MQSSIPVRAVLAMAALLAAGAAHGVSTATATLGDFHIGVTDLDPSDGIAPSATLDPRSMSSVFTGAGADVGNVTTAWSQQGASAFGAVSTSGDVGGTGGSASFAGDPFGAGADIVASAHGGPSMDVGFASAGVDTPGFYNLLTLSPYTEVTFGGFTTLAWNASNPSAAAYDEVDLSFYTLDGDSQDFVSMVYATAGYYGGGDGPLSGSAPSAPLWVTYDNDSDQSLMLGYYVGVFASASEFQTVPPPVDEPAGAALVLAGAALLRGLRRRRRGAAPPAVAFSDGSGGCPSAPSRCRARRPR
jgi:hypothetical protein